MFNFSLLFTYSFIIQIYNTVLHNISPTLILVNNWLLDVHGSILNLNIFWWNFVKEFSVSTLQRKSTQKGLNDQGCIKFLIPPNQIPCEEVKGMYIWLWRRIWCGKKGKGKQYHLSYNIKAVGKDIKWGKGERHKICGEENQY